MSDKANILVVDDNPRNIQLVGSILEENNYEPIVFLDGKSALDFLTKEKPDLILLDIMMPEMDGFEVCELIKSDENIRNIPLIFLTAKTEKEDLLKAFKIGAVDYVTKPFYIPELLARIKTHIELRRAKAEIKSLRGIIPICSSCKKIRNDKGYWEKLEAYISQYSDAEFSHGICPDCIEKLYPDLADSINIDEDL